MKKAMRKMIPAVIMLLISAMLVGTSTYAWFSMNRTVTVTGMRVTAKGNDNVTISTDDTNFYFAIDQIREGNLKPASSVDGVSFFYASTDNINSSTGNANSDTYTAYSEASGVDNSAANTRAGKTYVDKAFNTNYGITAPSATDEAYAYIDYEFFINATNSSNLSYLVMDKCNLLYSGTTTEVKAWRVAVFADSYTHTSTPASHDEVAVGKLVSILRPSSAQYFGADNSSNNVEAVSAVDTVSAVNSKIDDPVVIANNVTSGYYKVTVRLWLEGEDTTCTNDTFATLGADWTLDLSFSLAANNTTAVANIGSAGTIQATKSTVTGNATLTVAGETASTYQWYNASTNAAIVDATSASYVNTANETLTCYCVVTTTSGHMYRTNNVTLDAAPANP